MLRRRSLSEWFSVGLMRLEPITWSHSTAALLERVIKYEAVHPIQDWTDLQQRLYPNRRVFAFFHPTMPEEPLVILHTALRQQIARSMSELLDENRAGRQRCTLDRVVTVFVHLSPFIHSHSSSPAFTVLFPAATHLMWRQLLMPCASAAACMFHSGSSDLKWGHRNVQILFV